MHLHRLVNVAQSWHECIYTAIQKYKIIYKENYIFKHEPWPQVCVELLIICWNTWKYFFIIIFYLHILIFNTLHFKS